MKDYEGALGYYQQALTVQEKTLGKTHPDTLRTIMNMAYTYQVGLKDFMKAEKMYRQALDGYENSLGKQHEDTKLCAENMANLLGFEMKIKESTELLVQAFPHLLSPTEWQSEWYTESCDEDQNEIVDSIKELLES